MDDPQVKLQVPTKIVSITFQIHTGVDNFELCAWIERELEHSKLGAHPFNGIVTECKVIRNEYPTP